MVLIAGGIDPDWHESHLLIQLMNTGPMPRKELFNRVREEQSKKKVFGEEGITHSRSAYRYWLRNFIAHQIAIESEGQPRLTALGEWVANSEIGTLDDRYVFLSYLTCLECRRTGYMIVLRMEESTAITDSKGRLCMDTECTRCGQWHKRMVVCEGFSLAQFISIYRQTVSELRRAARTMPTIMLPTLR